MCFAYYLVRRNKPYTLKTKNFISNELNNDKLEVLHSCAYFLRVYFLPAKYYASLKNTFLM